MQGGPSDAPQLRLDHIQITVEHSAEAATIAFYRDVLGFEEIQKPELLKKNGGAWFKVGAHELHVSPEDSSLGNAGSKRHVCYLIEDLPHFRDILRDRGAEIIADNQPIAGWIRFYLRDPGGNRIEIAQRTTS